MENTPTIFAALRQGQDRPLVSEAIPSLATLIERRALSAEKAAALYQHLWMIEAAGWTEDEQRDFATGYFMASMDADNVAIMPPHCGAFTQNRADHLPTARRKLAYKAGVAFAQGKGSDAAYGIVRGAAFAFGMRPTR